MGAQLRIIADGPTSKDVKGVWLDGRDISKFTTGAEIKMRVGEPHRVTLHLFVDQLDLGLNADVEVTTPLLRREKVDA